MSRGPHPQHGKDIKPFTPGFQIKPYVVEGRDDILDDMREAFASGIANPNLSTLLIGAHGTGKTALMSRMRSMAVEEGWLVVSTTARPCMLKDRYQQSVVALRHLIEADSHANLSPVMEGPRALGWVHAAEQGLNWRTRMSTLLDQLSAYETGLLMTVDEVEEDVDELIRLAAVYQHFVCEGRRVALVLAGLPDNVNRLVSHKAVSFLRRRDEEPRPHRCT